MRKGAAGGHGSKNVVHSNVRTGRPMEKVSPRGVSQIGSSIGNHSTDGARIVKGGVEPTFVGNKPNSPLGNEVAKNVGAGGPGKGRDFISHCGTQGQYGSGGRSY